MIFDQDNFVNAQQTNFEYLKEEDQRFAGYLPDIAKLPPEYRLVQIVLDIKVPVPELKGYITLRDRFDWDLE